MSEIPVPSPHSELAWKRSRVVSAVMVAVLIGLGLGSRKFAGVLPILLPKQLGDLLWATMAFFGTGFLFPRLSTLLIGLLAFAFSCVIEVSKFVHLGWFDRIRAMGFGRLIFGYVFSWTNLVCYFVGIVLGMILENGLSVLRRRQLSKQKETLG